SRAAAGLLEFLFHIAAEGEIADLEVLGLVLDARAGGAVVDGAVGDLDLGAAVLAGAAHAQGDFIVLKHAVGNGGDDVLFQIQHGHVIDLPRLLPAVEIAVANDDAAALAFRRLRV